MEIPRRERRPASRSLLAAGVASVAVTALAILALDVPLARWLDRYHPLSLWDAGIEVLEYLVLFPLHPLASSFALALGMIVTTRVRRWRHHAPAWTFVAATHIVARYVTGELKEVTGRLRPRNWLPLEGDSFFRDGFSFPSGHVTLFASLAIPLAILVPRARVPLTAVAVFVCCARIAVNAHWISDTLAALALVALVAYLAGLAIRPLRAR